LAKLKEERTIIALAKGSSPDFTDAVEEQQKREQSGLV